MDEIKDLLISKSSELILIVDDVPSNLEIVSETLSSAGYDVVISISGERALQRLKRQSPDLILLDVMMPGIDGFEACRRLKADPKTCHIPVIFMTAVTDADSKIKGFELGAVDYITKPFQEQEVLARVKTHLKLQQLSRTLELRNAELQQLAEQLEQQVTDLEATQQELIQAEKMAILGQLTASIAHEINTPLGVIRGATDNIIAAFSASLQKLPDLIQQLSFKQQANFWTLVNAAVQNSQSLSTQDERQLRQHLQAELMAQGIDNAQTIAHQFALLRLGQDLKPYQLLLQDPKCSEILQGAYNLVLQQQSTSSIQQEVARAARIVFALKSYSHQSDAGNKVSALVTNGIEVALTLYHNRLKQGVEVIRRYQVGLPQIFCNPDELTQVWVNLIDNALYAMNQQGTLTIAVYVEAGYLTVEITDTGTGMLPEVQSRIFEPFYTTKPCGEGSGLGLKIVQQIVCNHEGKIGVYSRVGQTTFTVQLPLPPSELARR